MIAVLIVVLVALVIYFPSSLPPCKCGACRYCDPRDPWPDLFG